jgi:hypothetical protein
MLFIRVALLILGMAPSILPAQTWSPVGTGAASAVYALEVFNGELYVGGTFTEIGGVNANYLARWNGSGWSSVANLITFLSADGLYANDTALFIGDGGRVRYWNGTNLINLTGVSSSSFNSTAYSLAHFRDTLYVGGFFSSPFARIARWNGSAYEALTSGCNAQVSALQPFGDQLFVGGNFTVAGDSIVNRTALWNGTAWNRMGAGVNDDVFTHCIFQDTLYIAGRFTMANGQPASRVAKWNGSQWVRVGGTLNDFVTTMTVYRDQLYIGGAFTTPSRIARLSGTAWVPVGTGCDATLRTMEVYNDSLFVGGSFLTAGGVPANRIAKWHTPAPPQAAFSADASLLCTNECTTFMDASINGPFSYAWSFPGGVPSTSTDPMPTVCYSTPGSYGASLTVSNAGGSSTLEIPDVVSVEICSAVTEHAEAGMTLSPNPVRDQLFIRCPSNTPASLLQVIDPTGRVVYQRQVTGASIDLDTRELVSGTYLLVLSTADDRIAKRFVKE